MSKFYVVSSLAIAVTFFGSCMSRRNEAGNGRVSLAKSVTSNQPDLKGQMVSTLSEDEKKKLLESLVYTIAINPVQKDSKDDCADGATPTKFDSGINGLDKSTFETIKVKRGCNYVVSMKIGAKSDDGKSIKTLYISSWDDKKPSLLSRAELEKDKPTAVVSLFVTPQGKPFWDADLITTPGDSDVIVNSGLSKSFKLVGVVKESKYNTATFSHEASAVFKPTVAVAKDMYCGVYVAGFISIPTSTSRQGIQIFVDAKPEKSIIKFMANTTAEVPVAGFISPTTLGQTLAPDSANPTPASMDLKEVTAESNCFETEADALKKLNDVAGALSSSGKI
ncbi:MAG: hypothetical protein NTV34_19710 [Proteobacteria bacterium]|nr:hypothetical protein [Pseudomonadota bacterium]